MSDLTVVARCVAYDRNTGLFSRPDGSALGSRHPKGYVWIAAGGRKVLAHRLAWFVEHGIEPDGAIDHINRNRTDNRIANLRLASASQNQMNRGAQRNNTSGVPGVARDKSGRRWQAYIKVQGARRHLGIFERIEDAISARRAAQAVLFGEFAAG